MLEAELGSGWRSEFREFDEHPTAAASIGQVHRAVWSDGTDVAVKIQYPGVADAVAGDVRSLAVTLRLTSLVARGMAMPPLVAELRTRLGEELDYRTEADHQRAFAAAYAGDAHYYVPPVLAATRGVLVEPLDGRGRTGPGGPRRHRRGTGPPRRGLPALLPDLAGPRGAAAHRPASRQLPAARPTAGWGCSTSAPSW